jgi:hypothetical protein
LHRGPWNFSVFTDMPLIHKNNPRKIGEPTIGSLRADRRRSLPDSGEVAARVGGERVGKPPEAHLRANWVLGWGREALSGGGHRCRRVAAADPVAPARWRLRRERGRVGEL